VKLPAIKQQYEEYRQEIMMKRRQEAEDNGEFVCVTVVLSRKKWEIGGRGK